MTPRHSANQVLQGTAILALAGEHERNVAVLLRGTPVPRVIRTGKVIALFDWNRQAGTREQNDIASAVAVWADAKPPHSVVEPEQVVPGMRLEVCVNRNQFFSVEDLKRSWRRLSGRRPLAREN